MADACVHMCPLTMIHQGLTHCMIHMHARVHEVVVTARVYVYMYIHVATPAPSEEEN